MRGRFLFALFACAALALITSAGPTRAATYSVTCDGITNGQLMSMLNGSTAWTVGGTAHATRGDIIEINGGGLGVPCIGDLYLDRSYDGIDIRPHDGGFTAITTDIIDGSLQVSGAHVTIRGVALEGATLNKANPNGAAGVAGDGLYEVANVVVTSGGSIDFVRTVIQDGQYAGIWVTGGSSVHLVNALVQANGAAGVASPYSDGIFASNASAVKLGEPGPSDGASTVSANGVTAGTCQGFGLHLLQGSSLEAYDSSIGTGGSNPGTSNGCGQILLESGSTARLRGTTVAQPNNIASGPAIRVLGASGIRIDTNFDIVSDYTSTIESQGSGQSALLLAGSSSAVIQGATFTSNSTGTPTIEATGASSIVLAGGNTIQNQASGGAAFQIDHSAALIQQSGSQLGYPVAAESVSGGGVVQVQSSADLGQGLVSSSPSISWTTGSGGISVQQNSSFRVSGGVSITGAVAITQGSNGFANTANGGTNAITSASCPFTNVPSSHWAAPAKVTPSVPSATSYASATSPQCLSF